MSCPPVGVGQGDALEDVLNANVGRDYTVNRGDSPASIAKKFGVTLDQLLNANPQKSTTYVKGVRTWTDLSINEGLSLPKAGVRLGYVAGVGDYATDTVRALRGLDPCDRENVALVCAAQRMIGLEPDGKWGNDSYIAALQYDPEASPPCSPRPAWWPRGRSACGAANPVVTQAARDLAELEAMKRAREGSGVMSGVRFNGSFIPGLGLGQDAAPPPAAPPVGLTPEQAAAQAAGAAAEASGKAAMAARHTWGGWWHHLSTIEKVGVVGGPVVVVGTGVFLATRGKKKSRRR